MSAPTPRSSRQVLARYHALLQDAIDAHGGTVAKFMGDGMMATFGIPEIAEDDAERAVRAGIDIQRPIRATSPPTSRRGTARRSTARVGVNTGEVVIASGDADLVGDALERRGPAREGVPARARARRRRDVAAHARRARRTSRSAR